MRVFTFPIFMLLGLLTANAQDFPIQFADAQGNIIADGTELTLDQPLVEESEFDDAILVPSGVYVLNTTDGEVACGTDYSVTHLSNGSFQTCFPLNCTMTKSTGNWTSEVGTLSAHQLKDMLTEWIPDAAGTADAQFQLLTYKMNPITKKYTLDKSGPQIKMHFVYDPSAIRALDSDRAAISSVAYYTVNGARVSVPAHGLYLVKTTYANGKTITTRHIF